MDNHRQKLLLGKFRGTLLGALVGDCCGRPYEYSQNSSKLLTSLVKKDLDKLEKGIFKGSIKNYSDDTAMTKVLASTLVNGFSQKKLAINFTKEFFTEGPNRDYSKHMSDAFVKLRDNNCLGPAKPAKEQCDGTGPMDNGGAMRVAPIALFCWYRSDLHILRLVQKATEITHKHRLGMNGALLQAYAVHQALLLDPIKNKINIFEFIDHLIKKIKLFEIPGKDETSSGYEYVTKLELMKKYLSTSPEPSKDDVMRNLGRKVLAEKSVPTAIYCFLRSERDDVKRATSSQNPFRTTLEYAISLGGDADTIGSMACAIAGAYYGEKAISRNILRFCEGSRDVSQLADELYKKVV